MLMQADALQRFKPLDKLAHDFKDGPAVIGLDFVPVALFQSFFHPVLIRLFSDAK